MSIIQPNLWAYGPTFPLFFQDNNELEIALKKVLDDKTSFNVRDSLIRKVEGCAPVSDGLREKTN